MCVPLWRLNPMLLRLKVAYPPNLPRIHSLNIIIIIQESF